MTTETDLSAQLLALQQQMAALKPAAPVAPAASPWAAPAAPVAPAMVTGVAVPAKVPTPHGTLRVYLSLPAEAASSPQALQAAIDALVAAGIPLDTWQPRESGGGSWGGNSGGGGWSRGGGSYGGGYRR